MPLTVEGRLTNEIIKEGANQYVMKYFVDAIRNELVGLQSDLNGLQSDDEISRKIISTLRHLPRRTFTSQEFAQEHFGNQAMESRAEVDRILTMSYFAGALGNLVQGRGESYLQYYHRREESEIYLRGQLILHNALARAWNIRWLLHTCPTRCVRFAQKHQGNQGRGAPLLPVKSGVGNKFPQLWIDLRSPLCQVPEHLIYAIKLTNSFTR